MIISVTEKEDIYQYKINNVSTVTPQTTSRLLVI